MNDQNDKLNDSKIEHNLVTFLNSLSKLVMDYCSFSENSYIDVYNNQKKILLNLSNLTTLVSSIQTDTNKKKIDSINSYITEVTKLSNLVKENAKVLYSNLNHFLESAREIFKKIKERKSFNSAREQENPKKTISENKSDEFDFPTNYEMKEISLANKVLNFIKAMETLEECTFTKSKEIKEKKQEFIMLKVSLRKECEEIKSKDHEIKSLQETEIYKEKIPRFTSINSKQEELMQNIKELKEKIKQLKDENEQTQENIKFSVNELEKLIKDKEQRPEEIKVFNYIIKKLQSNGNVDIEEEIDYFRGSKLSLSTKQLTYEELRKEVERLEQENEDLLRDKSRIKKKADENIQKKESEIRDLQNSIRSYKLQLEESNEEIFRLKTISKTATLEVELLKKQVKDFDILRTQVDETINLEEKPKTLVKDLKNILVEQFEFISIQTKESHKQDKKYTNETHKIVTNKKFLNLNWYLLRSKTDDKAIYDNFTWVTENEINTQEFDSFTRESDAIRENTNQFAGVFRKLEEKEEEISKLNYQIQKMKNQNIVPKASMNFNTLKTLNAFPQIEENYSDGVFKKLNSGGIEEDGKSGGKGLESTKVSGNSDVIKLEKDISELKDKNNKIKSNMENLLKNMIVNNRNKDFVKNILNLLNYSENEISQRMTMMSTTKKGGMMKKLLNK